MSNFLNFKSVINSNTVFIRYLGFQLYESVFYAMNSFTEQRNYTTPDEIWLVEHFPVFTKGQANKLENLSTPDNIPVFQSDRGGKTTYHGPGQQIMYVLLNLRRRKLSICKLIEMLEQTVINTLTEFNIKSYNQSNAPGVYVNNMKICSLGLCIRKGCSLHGLSLNVDMDLSPFLYINPCGNIGMEMTQVSEWVKNIKLDIIRSCLITQFLLLLK